MIDSHCHFDFPPLHNFELWQQAQGLGVKSMIIPGVTPEQWPKAQQATRIFQGSYYAVGWHPCWLNDEPVDKILKELTAEKCQPFTQDERCVAIGECGLDKRLSLSLNQQMEVLKPHIELANQFKLPLILHNVHAHNEMIRLLKKRDLPFGGVIHAFSGSYETGKTYCDMGFYLGIGGTITYPRANKTRDAVKRLPLQHLLLETDAPDMPLQGEQGQPNSPANLPKVAHCLSQLRAQPLQDIHRVTTENSRRLFNITC